MITSKFFNANEIKTVDEEGREVIKYDKVYYAEDFASYFAKLIGDGIFAQLADQLQVVAKEGLTITVKTGAAWIEGYMCDNTEDFDITLQPNLTTSPQLVKIVCVLQRNEDRIWIQAEQGVSSLLPVNDAVKHELVLATFTLPVGTAIITNTMVSDRRFQDEYCGIVAGLVKQISTTDLFKQYDDMFDAWFERIKGQLSGDVAGNLQNQIDAIKDADIMLEPVDTLYIQGGSSNISNFKGLRYNHMLNHFLKIGNINMQAGSMVKLEPGTYVGCVRISNVGDLFVSESSSEVSGLTNKRCQYKFEVTFAPNYDGATGETFGSVNLFDFKWEDGKEELTTRIAGTTYVDAVFSGKKYSYYNDDSGYIKDEWYNRGNYEALIVPILFSIDYGDIKYSDWEKKNGFTPSNYGGDIRFSVNVAVYCKAEGKTVYDTTIPDDLLVDVVGFSNMIGKMLWLYKIG